MRAEYAVLILFAARRHGRDGLGDQPRRRSTSGSSCRASRPTCSPPTAARTSARPRRASNISCSARLRAASCSTAFRCSTASPARRASPASPRHSRAERPRSACCSASCSCLPASRSRRARCRSTCGRPTSTKARRRRSPPSSPPRQRSPRSCSRPASASRRSAPATDAWRQIVIFAALASIFLGAIAAFGQTNIKRLLAYSSINNVGFALIGLAAGTPRGASSVLFYMAVYVVMTLGAFLCVLWMRDAEGRADREHRQPVGPVADPARPSPPPSPSSCSALPASRRCSASGPSWWCSTRRSASGYIALAVAGILGTVIGAYYYLQIVKVMYMDEPARAVCAASREPVQGALIFARRAARLAARLSADRPAWLADRQSRGIPVLTRIRIVERTGSTNADLLADPSAIEGDWLVALAPGRGKRPAGPRLGLGERQFLRQHARSAARRRSARADAFARRRPCADRSDRRRRSGQPLMLKWPNDVMLLGREARRHPARAERRSGRRSASASTSLAPRSLPDRRAASLDGQIRPAGVRAAARRQLRACSTLWRQSEPAAARSGVAGARASRWNPADRAFGSERDGVAAASTGSNRTARCAFAGTMARSRSSAPATSSL